ncbi:hypothetical protein [Sphingobacterium sp. UBA5996]|nr:hypothetical protein [Sphingobacterium sp. UBA5996]
MKSHPKLTQVGGYREQMLLGNYKTADDYWCNPFR